MIRVYRITTYSIINLGSTNLDTFLRHVYDAGCIVALSQNMRVYFLDFKYSSVFVTVILLYTYFRRVAE
jgi:hypothetical protein